MSVAFTPYCEKFFNITLHRFEPSVCCNVCLLCYLSSLCQLNRVKVVEKEKDELEDAKKEAEEFLAMKADIAKKQLTLYQRYMLVICTPVMCLL